MRCRDIRVAKLCELRLNDVPATAQRCYERALDMLAAAQTGYPQLPDCPARKGMAMAMSNVRTRARPWPHPVAEPSAVHLGRRPGYDRKVDPTDFPDPGSEDAAKERLK